MSLHEKIDLKGTIGYDIPRDQQLMERLQGGITRSRAQVHLRQVFREVSLKIRIWQKFIGRKFTCSQIRYCAWSLEHGTTLRIKLSTG